METLRTQILENGEVLSMCFPEDSPVSHSVSQEIEKVQQMTVTSGRRCLEQFEKFYPVGSWERTLGGLLVGRKAWYSKQCALIWKLRGIGFKRLLFQLVPLAHRTEEIGYGLLPTIMTQGIKKCGKKGTYFIPINMLPTPAAIDSGSGRMNRSLSAGAASRPSLAMGARMGLLPTPKAQDYKSALYDRKRGNLQEVTAQMYENGTSQTSRLNPLYVAEMMGFPVDWTLSPFLHGDGSQSRRTEMR